MKKMNFLLALALPALFFVACKKDNYETPDSPPVKSEIFSASGDITAKLAEFRTRLGDQLNTAPGPFTTGRREINWDAVPVTFTNNNNFPHDFFGSFDPALPNGRKRGFVITNTTDAFRVDTTDCKEINALYEQELDIFSPKRIFAAIGSNTTDCAFRIPGTSTAAFIKGFGVVFSDVDVAGSTHIEFFSGEKSLGKFNAPVRTAASSISFLGVYFPDDRVTGIRITTGDGKLSSATLDVSNGGSKDIVAMDDFLYNEPQ